MADESQDWIEHAIKHHGALKKKAESVGESTKSFAEKHQSDDGVTGHQARLAITLMNMHNQGKQHDSSPVPTSPKEMSYSTESMPKDN
jgi:hypothetical protein